MRRTIAYSLCVVVFVFSFWLGERGTPTQAMVLVVGAFIAASVVALIIPGKLWVKLVGGVAAFTLCTVSLFLGWLSFTHAYGECVEKGENVRVWLSEYYKSEGHFPERLGQLKGFNLCARVLHPTLLEYEKTEHGYVLSFGDWLVEHKATETEPFMAHK